MVVERNPVGTEGARPGLTDVVEESRQSDDLVEADLVDNRDRVGEDVLVPVHRVLLQRERRQLGQELLGQACAHEEPQAFARALDDEELVELVADPLGGHDREPRPHHLDGPHELGVGHEAVTRHEARRSQHAQRVVAERLLGGQGRAQTASGKVGGAVERVDQAGLGNGERHGVDREIAA